jgi:hypothetical protein
MAKMDQMMECLPNKMAEMQAAISASLEEMKAMICEWGALKLKLKM